MTETQVTIIFKNVKPLKFPADEIKLNDDWILIYKKDKIIGTIRENEVKMVFLSPIKKDEMDEAFFSDDSNLFH